METRSPPRSSASCVGRGRWTCPEGRSSSGRRGRSPPRSSRASPLWPTNLLSSMPRRRPRVYPSRREPIPPRGTTWWTRRFFAEGRHRSRSPSNDLRASRDTTGQLQCNRYPASESLQVVKGARPSLARRRRARRATPLRDLHNLLHSTRHLSYKSGPQ